MSQDKSFNIAIDKGNNTDQQMMKKAGRVMAMQVRERFVPFSDKHTLKKWAHGAGHTVELPEDITGDALIDALIDAETYYDNTFVPTGDREVAVRFSDLGKIRRAERWKNLEKQTDKYLVNGDFTKFNTLKVFGMPDNWFPTKVRALCFHSKSVLAPMKIKDLRQKNDSENVDGILLLGRFYFDAFVIGARCDGVIAIVENGCKTADVSITKGTTTTTIVTSTSGATIYYTTDGSDPRYSNTRAVYSAAFANPATGTEIKAVAEKIETGNLYWSDLAEITA